ncbi:hypothetical protein FAM09_16565 [Niastella caeni]|uniref:Uncharacterized protein n=1 Tax=Niastella caeni TaxID=2569763 RepID=A0A4S8HRY4_9BACT|nr:hypothetical protein [Niastella caeni]THU38288.1 hypothetical protein FAM09_16565 [Niastella caeni]
MTIKNLSCDSFTGIMDAWYNQLCDSLHLSINNFQLSQPVSIPANDEGLCSYFNLVPPKTLKYNHWYYDQPTFFGQYAAIVNQLQFPESSFEKDIGKATYAKWNSYVKGLPQPPPENTLPSVWFQWAVINAPSVANIGRTDLSCQVLIKSGQAALAPYQGLNAKAPDYSPTFSDLTNTLKASPSADFSFDSMNGNPDVSKSWVAGIDPDFFGIWTGSWCGFLINKKFAQSAISISATFDHFSVIPVTPGAWYNSGLLHLALASKSVPPWNSNTGWDTYFGTDGALKYAIGSVLAVDGISLSLTSDADFSSEEQLAIKSQVEMGYWPIYCQQIPSVITNDISFESGRMTIKCQSNPGNPVLLGNNVFRIGQYLGGG